MKKNQFVLIKPRLSVLTVIEEGTLPGIAKQPGIQETGVEMLGMQGTEEEIMEVILNGHGEVRMTKNEAGNEVEVPLVTAQQILARTRERKAKSTLLMAIPDENLARFYGIKDAKTLWATIKT
nr:xylulose kinase-1 [Tanacetum cinerariifolium]